MLNKVFRYSGRWVISRAGYCLNSEEDKLHDEKKGPAAHGTPSLSPSQHSQTHFPQNVPYIFDIKKDVKNAFWTICHG